MMMTSGEAVKYKSSLDAFSQIVKTEGPKSLFKCVGANTLNPVIPEYVILGRNGDREEVVVLLLKHANDSEELLPIYSIIDYGYGLMLFGVGGLWDSAVGQWHDREQSESTHDYLVVVLVTDVVDILVWGKVDPYHFSASLKYKGFMEAKEPVNMEEDQSKAFRTLWNSTVPTNIKAFVGRFS
ncbi:hypothetical protein KIW84_031845 [Lathyrus oleraceus]|uniref:ADP/ATP translocase n=1 Tax=Pisum sativum TaxID=3888 RepID=A0A9D4XTG7_PEA|nr:hypothetical protein KIW84_031845 [Pisum sativum]